MKLLAEDGNAIELVKEELTVFSAWDMDLIGDEAIDDVAVSILNKLDAYLLLRK